MVVNVAASKPNSFLASLAVPPALEAKQDSAAGVTFLYCGNRPSRPETSYSFRDLFFSRTKRNLKRHHHLILYTIVC